MKHSGLIFGIVFGIVLTSFTVYALLDTFVIERSYSVVNQENNESTNNASNSSNSLDSTDNSSTSSTSIDITGAEVIDTYDDGNISIQLLQYREYDTDIYVADIQISSIDYLKTAFAKDTYGKNVTETTSSMASSNNAILAINGDYYGARENGFVIRNGTLYRETSAGNESLVIDADGNFNILEEDDTNIEDLINENVLQAFSFGPGLVENGEISVSEGEEVGKAMASNPRTAIAQIGELHYLFVVSDGRTSESEGLSLYELASFLQDKGVICAYNLDGGGSSTMVFNGNVINNPTTNGNHISERKVSDIIYVG